MPTLEELQALDPEQRKQFEDIRVMMGLDENFQPPELDSELVNHITEERGITMLKHPLVFEIPYSPMVAGRANKMLAAKKAAIAEEEAKGNWEGTLWLYERPYRIGVFYGFRDELSDSEYWRILSELWSDTENMWQNGYTWKLLMDSDRPGRAENFMDDDERAALAELPDELTIYRGTSHGLPPGMSWTLDRDRAEWFARRYQREGYGPEMMVGHVSKKDVIGYLTGRSEDEIVANHENIHNIERALLIDVNDEAKGMKA